MGTNRGAYKLVLVLHILCAIVGFGGVVLNGLYGQQAKARRGAEGVAVAQANLFVSIVAEYFIYAVFVLGVLLVLMSDKLWKFDQTWVATAMALYLVAVGISHAVLFPNARRVNALMAELAVAGPPADDAAGPPPQVAEIERRGRMFGMASTFLHVLLVVILALMVWKPI